MNKKLLGLFLAAIVIVNPVFAASRTKQKTTSCGDIVGGCIAHTIVFPLQIIPVGTVEDYGQKRCKTLDEFLEGKEANKTYWFLAIASKLAIIGGATAGVVAAVKYYKKKKQAVQEDVVPAAENTLLQNNQDVQVTIEEAA